MKSKRILWKRFLLLILVLFHCGEPSKEFISSRGKWLIDEKGRTLILRGINFSERSKRPPFLPEVPYEDIDKLKEWGFNAVRFLIIWEAIEPEKGTFSDEYLEKLTRWVDEFSKREIYILLDMHQDLYARKLGGDGAPEWAVFDLPYEPVQPWYLNYLSKSVIENFDRFWRDESLQEEYIKAWEFVVDRFKENRFVIGYDLMNEPFFGSSNPLTGEFERSYLQPFYEKIISRLKKIDKDHLYFFEPNIIAGGGFHCFLKNMPFDGLVYAPHYYDPTVLWEFPYDGDEDRTYSSFVLREKEAERWGVPWVLGEFGILFHTYNSEEYLEDHMSLIEDFMIGSFYWNYNRERLDDMSPVDENGKEKCLSYCPLDVLSRPYPQKTYGELLRFKFDRIKKEFTMEFMSYGGKEPTEIYIPLRHFGKEPRVFIEGGRFEYLLKGQTFYLLAKEKKKYKVIISP
jgi:endoglycosylceramidase